MDIESAARETWLCGADTSSPAWSPVGIIPAPERKGVKQAEQSEPRGWMGTAGYVGDRLPNACLAALPGSQCELYPAPPSLPWKHGGKGKGSRSGQIHPHPTYTVFGTIVPIFRIREKLD